MSILVHEERPLGITTSGGSWSANTASISGLLQQVIVKPATESTMYDFAIINDKSDIIYNRTDASGNIVEEINLPLHGIYTLRLQNATRDEAFTVLLTVRER